jgi:integrase
MARRAEGWKLHRDERYGTWLVRFTHQGRRIHVSTGETDHGRALEAGARLFAESVSGRRAQVGVTSVRFAQLAAKWLVSVEPELDHLTYRQYKMYCHTHFGPFFVWTDRLTDAGCRDYSSARLRKVSRSTVSRELAVLRRICEYGVERGMLEGVPTIKPLGKRVQGNRSIKREPKALDPRDVERFLAALPEEGIRARDGKRAIVKARWIVAWETGLRPATLDALEAPHDYKPGSAVLVVRDEADKARFGRTLPLSPRAREALRSVCPDVGLIFGRHDHRAHFRAAAAEAGLEHVTPYDLRHSRLTLWASRSTDLTAIGYLAGHKHATTTSRYVHQAQRGAEEVLRAAGGFGTGSGRGTKKRGGRKKS